MLYLIYGLNPHLHLILCGTMTGNVYEYDECHQQIMANDEKSCSEDGSHHNFIY